MTLKTTWWKILGMVLVLGSIYVGLTAKTGPGVAEVTPSSLNPSDPFSLTVYGYNTEFSQNNPPSLWLKHKEILICADEVVVKDVKTVQVKFGAIPNRLDSTERIALSVLIEDKTNGMFLGLDAVTFQFDSEIVERPESCSNRPQKLEPSYFSFPFRTTLYESIRNLNFHVPMWFAMIILLLVSFISSILYLNTEKIKYDHLSNAFASVGLVFGVIGIITGSLWARFTWMTFWTADPKLNGAAVAVLMYVAYQILRTSIDDEDKVARIASVYNVLAYPIFIVLIIVLPRLADFSLHPGSGDSVGFNQYDLNSNLRMVFYPAVLGWILTGTWIANIAYRIKKLAYNKNLNE